MVGLVHFFPLYPLPLCTLLVQRIRLYRYCDKYSAAALLAPSLLLPSLLHVKAESVIYLGLMIP